jgi:SAM-dependent methyltransferase
MDRTVRTIDDVMALLDELFAPEANRWSAEGSGFWDEFYADRARAVPFFVDKPDASLAGYLDRGLIAPRTALDLGCGPGRNALFLAERGIQVDAVDLSPTAIAWAKERAAAAGPRSPIAANIRWHTGNAFELARTELAKPYDLIVDSGCFHHLPPHRRISYLELIDRVLAPGGHLAFTCFSDDDQGGSRLPDAQFYRDGQLHGGLAYTPEALRRIFADLTEIELRRVRDEPDDSPYFGVSFLWAALFRREPVS